MLIPPVTQLPLFIGLSMVFGRASVPPTVLDSEAFFTLTSLSHADPTVTLPIILGVITFANVDASRWFMTPQARIREQQVAEWTAKRRAAGETVVEPKRIFQSTLRIAAVGRILFAALVPGVSSQCQLLYCGALMGLGRAYNSTGRRPPRSG